jgi:hypothetical protein
MPSTRKPASDKQLAANRANAARSTGPKTPEGKARSAQNAVKHGFTASTFTVVRLEELKEIANLKADLVSVYQPVNAQELFALERMALAQQSMLRAARLESGLFTNSLNETLDGEGRAFCPMSKELAGEGDANVAFEQNLNYCLADGFMRQARQSNGWSVFLRYQAQAERQYRRALEEFNRLKALRPELPNEPNVGQPILAAAGFQPASASEASLSADPLPSKSPAPGTSKSAYPEAPAAPPSTGSRITPTPGSPTPL